MHSEEGELMAARWDDVCIQRTVSHKRYERHTLILADDPSDADRAAWHFGSIVRGDDFVRKASASHKIKGVTLFTNHALTGDPTHVLFESFLPLFDLLVHCDRVSDQLGVQRIDSLALKYSLGAVALTPYNKNRNSVVQHNLSAGGNVDGEMPAWDSAALYLRMLQGLQGGEATQLIPHSTIFAPSSIERKVCFESVIIGRPPSQEEGRCTFSSSFAGRNASQESQDLHHAMMIDRFRALVSQTLGKDPATGQRYLEEQRPVSHCVRSIVLSTRLESGVGRHLKNWREVKEMLEQKTGASVHSAHHEGGTSLDDYTTPRYGDYIRPFATADLLLVPHGAHGRWMSIMPYGADVVETFVLRGVEGYKCTRCPALMNPRYWAIKWNSPYGTYIGARPGLVSWLNMTYHFMRPQECKAGAFMECDEPPEIKGQRRINYRWCDSFSLDEEDIDALVKKLRLAGRICDEQVGGVPPQNKHRRPRLPKPIPTCTIGVP